MKILHVNLASGFRGGERQTVILIKELAKKGIVQALVCQKNSPLRVHLKEINNLVFFDSRNLLSGHLISFKADIAHAHEAKAVSWCLIHKFLTKTPYIITRRIDKPLKNKFSTRIAYSNAFARIAISSVIKGLIEEHNWGSVNLIPSSAAKFKSDSENTKKFKNLYSDKFLVGHAGALVDKHKGQKVFIDAIKIINNSANNMEFFFLGSGSDETMLKQYSEGISNIHWLGFKENIADYLAGLDLFVFPSRNEGLGSTLLDVMDHGVPIIASEVGGIPDIIINNDTGLLFENGNAEQLANAILKLHSDFDLRKLLAQQAKLHLKNFTPEKMTEKYLDIYKKPKFKLNI